MYNEVVSKYNIVYGRIDVGKQFRERPWDCWRKVQFYMEWYIKI